LGPTGPLQRSANPPDWCHQKIAIAAEISHQEEFEDLSTRLRHHFGSFQGLRFLLIKKPGFRLANWASAENLTTGKSLGDFPVFFGSAEFLLLESLDEWMRQAADSRAALVYSEDFYEKNKARLEGLGRVRRYYCDPLRSRKEGGNMIQAAFDLLDSEIAAANLEESRTKFLRMAEEIGSRHEECFLLATGPSIENYSRHPMADAFCIASNSSILNRGLMAHAKPQILVFADPVFHFGVSEYAARFREECLRFLEEHSRTRVVVPMRYYALLKSLWPDCAERVIGMPWKDRGGFNYCIDEARFFTRATDNILTLLLLPLATTFAKRIKLIGCDGRKLEENDYFWGHGRSVQLHAEMESVRKSHPAFFEIDYNDYYTRHCDTLCDFIETAEACGYSFRHCGPSHIPVLARRREDPQTDVELAVGALASEGCPESPAAPGQGVLIHNADWQTPAITEKHAADCVGGRGGLPEEVAYLGFPWATLFDLLNKSHPRAGVLLEKLHGLARQVGESRPAAVVTVCQHVDLGKYARVVAGAGVTDVFWSHATKGVRTLAEGGGVSLHPFPLYPVHVAQEVSPETARPFLFSFAGAIENPCYLTAARLWIWEHLRDHPKGRVVARGMWHYHGVVYEAQIQGRALGEEKGRLEKEEEFRDLLARSLFALCPSGSGPNSIRLWEALASGAIPVLISDTYLPPGDLREWEEAVVFCDETRDAIAALPSQLEAIAADPQRLARMREGCRRLARKFGPENFGSCIFEWARSRSSSRRVLSGNREFGLGDLAKRILADGTANARRASVFLACVDSQLMLEGRAFLKTLEAEGELRAAVQQALKSCSEKERAFHGRAMEFARQRG